MKPFIKALKNKTRIKHSSLLIYIGQLIGSEVMLVRCGVGLMKSAEAMKSLIGEYEITRVIMSGTAGGIDARLRIGDTVVSTEIICHEPGLGIPNSAADTVLLDKARKSIEQTSLQHPVYFGRISSGSKFITGKNRKLIAEKYNPLCADMETATVAQVCADNGIPFIAVRSVSDTAVQSGLINFIKHVSLASRNSFNAVCRIL
jgi:adenosylhomocysteine nucleosidase